jgi:hypothetical protein
MSKAWFKSIRKVLMSGADAAKVMFPTTLITRLTREELIAKAKGDLPADFDRRGYQVSANQLRKEAKADREAAAKLAGAPKVVKTAKTTKPAVNINTNTQAPKSKAGKKK